MDVTIKKIIHIGASIEHKNGTYIFFGLPHVVLRNKENRSSKLAIDFSYFLPNGKNGRVNFNTYELTLKYLIN